MSENPDPYRRYGRQMMLPDFGKAGQQRLAATRVLIVGVGGLGSPTALYLTGAGVGTIGLADDDRVSLDNLHRQILYGEAETGLPKAEEAARRLRRLNSTVSITAIAKRLTEDNALELIGGYDIVVDGCDNFATRYVIDDACATLGRPYVYGAICGLEGQVAVFGYGRNARRYRDLYPDEAEMLRMPHPGKQVSGPTAGMTGCVMAQQVLDIARGAECALAGKLWTADLRTMQTLVLDI